MDEQKYIDEAKKELELFYAPYFVSDTELQNFLSGVFDDENGFSERRQMVFQVQRFVSLANDIDKIRPARDSLRILFLKFGLDALSSLAGYTKNTKNTFYGDFCKCFSKEGSDYILNNFKLSSFVDEYNGHSFEVSHDINLNDFFNIVKITRDAVAHDFTYWEMQFFAYDTESIWCTSIETDKNIILSYKYHREKKKSTIYHFETTLNYEKFIYYFIEACVKFISNQKFTSKIKGDKI